MSPDQSFLRKHIEKTVELTDEEFELVASLFHPASFRKNEFLIREDQKVNSVFFIRSGLVKLFCTDDNADEYIVSFAMEDWWETDFGAFLNESQATLNLVCLEDTEVLCLSLSNFRELCSSVSKMEHFFLEKSLGGHIANQNRIISMLTMNARDKYERFLKLYPSFQSRISKKVLASYLGVTRETLSRLLPAKNKK